MTFFAKRSVTLSSDYEYPLLGLGTWQMKNSDQLKAALKAAIRVGYNHIDTAAFYQNQDLIGNIIQEFPEERVAKRSEIFITAKLLPSHHRREMVPICLKQQLEKLKTKYVDLFLIYFPVPFQYVESQPLLPFGPNGKILIDLGTNIEETWAGMEDCVTQHLAKSIGVSNFNISQIERLLKTCKIKPTVNQVECHPSFQNTKLIEFCQKKGLAVAAYNQLGPPAAKGIGEIAAKYGKSTAQVILRWHVQRNVVAVWDCFGTPPSRIEENYKVWNFRLTSEDLQTIAAMDVNKRVLWFDGPGIRDHPDYPFKNDEENC